MKRVITETNEKRPNKDLLAKSYKVTEIQQMHQEMSHPFVWNELNIGCLLITFTFVT